MAGSGSTADTCSIGRLEPMLRHVNLPLRLWATPECKHFTGCRLATARFLGRLVKTRAELYSYTGTSA